MCSTESASNTALLMPSPLARELEVLNGNSQETGVHHPALIHHSETIPWFTPPAKFARSLQLVYGPLRLRGRALVRAL